MAGNEPLDGKLAYEEPRLLRRSIELLIEKRILTKEQLSSRIPLAVFDIERLAGLTPGFISERSPYDLDPPVVVLSPQTSGRRNNLPFR
jgi:hypothetical protein